MRDALRELSYESEVYSEDLIGEFRGLGRPLSELVARPEDGLIVHYSTWSRAVVVALESHAQLLLRYHNVTPARWFEGVNEFAAQQCRLARSALPLLASRTALALADSEFNRGELLEAGYSRTAVLPILMPDSSPGLKDGRRDRSLILTVGRIAPNKRIDEVIRVFAAFQRGCRPDSALAIVGSGLWFEPYERECRSLVRDLGVDNVSFTGTVSEEEKESLFADASAYICLSEHEGFGVPLVEAMRWDVPVLARAAGAIPETLGAGGLVVETKSRAELAELLEVLVADPTVRAAVVGAQRRELRRFEPASVRARFGELLEEALR